MRLQCVWLRAIGLPCSALSSRALAAAPQRRREDTRGGRCSSRLHADGEREHALTSVLLVAVVQRRWCPRHSCAIARGQQPREREQRSAAQPASRSHCKHPSLTVLLPVCFDEARCSLRWRPWNRQPPRGCACPRTAPCRPRPSPRHSPLILVRPSLQPPPLQRGPAIMQRALARPSQLHTRHARRCSHKQPRPPLLSLHRPPPLLLPASRGLRCPSRRHRRAHCLRCRPLLLRRPPPLPLLLLLLLLLSLSRPRILRVFPCGQTCL